MSAIMQKIEHDMFTGIFVKITLFCLIFIIIIISFLTLSIVSMFERTLELKTITYNVSGVSKEDKKYVLPVIERGLKSWEDSNPGVIFERGMGGLNIVFTGFIPPFTAGMGICPLWSNSEGGCYIFLNPILIDAKHMLANTVAHEIGHILGVGHVDDENHLMYGVSYINLGGNSEYNVPNRLKEYDYIYGDYGFDPISMSCNPYTVCQIIYEQK